MSPNNNTQSKNTYAKRATSPWVECYQTHLVYSNDGHRQTGPARWFEDESQAPTREALSNIYDVETRLYYVYY
jgi:hypothetical protein